MAQGFDGVEAGRAHGGIHAEEHAHERAERAGRYMGAWYTLPMRIIALRTLREFWIDHADVEMPLLAWYADAKKAEWKTPADIKAVYASASIVGSDRVVFNIKGNTYRLIVKVDYTYSVVYIRFIGTHAEYDKIDAATV